MGFWNVDMERNAKANVANTEAQLKRRQASKMKRFAENATS